MTWLPRKTVVVPVDFSNDSFAALRTALELVDDPVHLHVVHVLPVLEANDPGVIWHLIDDAGRSQHAAEALAKELADRRLPQPQVVIRFGDPGHQIADYAAEVEAGLIVLSSHGKSGLTRLLIGSAAERVVRLAHCPVLVLKR
jgi:nucleotide-binding universal stress UspA family protein